MRYLENQQSISEWADQTFGPVTDPKTAFERMDKEYKELRDFISANDPYGYGDPHCAKEMADIQILLWRCATVCGFDLSQAVNEKMQVNRKRKWQLDGRGHGQHIEEGATMNVPEIAPTNTPTSCSDWTNLMFVGRCSVCDKRLIVVHRVEDGGLLSRIVHYEISRAGIDTEYSPACPGAKIVRDPNAGVDERRVTK